MAKNPKIVFTSITQDMFTLLSAIMTNQYRDGHYVSGNPVWASSLEHGFKGSKVGRLINSAQEAGWVGTNGDGSQDDDFTIYITHKGADVRDLFISEIKEGLKARVRSDAKAIDWANAYADTMAITRKKEAEAKAAAMAEFVAKAAEEAAKKANDQVDGEPVKITQTDDGPVIRPAKRVTFSGELRACGLAKLKITGDGMGGVNTTIGSTSWVGKMNPGEAHPLGDKVWTISSITSLTQAWRIA